MITKKEFIEFINAYKKYESGVDRFDMSITGKAYPSILSDTDWGQAVGIMLDCFLCSHFTEDGVDIIDWWLFEEVNHVITQTIDSDLFHVKSEIEYDVNDINDLWEYLYKFKKDYIKNV